MKKVDWRHEGKRKDNVKCWPKTSALAGRYKSLITEKTRIKPDGL